MGAVQLPDTNCSDAWSTGLSRLPEWDKFFVGFDAMSQKGMLPLDGSVPISSWIRTTEDGWMMLEDRVLHRDRAGHRLPHGSLIKSVEVYVHYITTPFVTIRD